MQGKLQVSFMLYDIPNHMPQCTSHELVCEPVCAVLCCAMLSKWVILGEATLPVSKAHPMEITTDGSGTVFGGQARRDRLIVEIMDPGRKTIGSTSLAEMGVDEDAAIQEVCTLLLFVLVCAAF